MSSTTQKYAETPNAEIALELVQPLYDFLSGKVGTDLAFINMSADWRSYSSETDFRSIEETAASLDALRTKVVPDLKWRIDDIVLGEGYLVVRGEGSGTPAQAFLGVPFSGKSFRIMSIDIHKIADGVIVSTWHVENWTDAIQQLAVA